MKIIYLVNKKYYLTKMSRVRFHGIQALSKLPSVNLIWWGVGWPDYNNSLSVSDNLKNKFKNKGYQYDFIIVYKPLEMIDFNLVPGKKIIRYNEMYDTNWTCQEIDQSGCQYVICHHENDYIQYKKLYATKNPAIQFFHIAHCVEQSIFFSGNLPFSYRKHDIVFSGAISNHYPLRQKFKNIIKYFQSNKQYTIYQYPHPGYDLKDAHTDKYQHQLAEVYRNAKICLTCSGKPKSRFGKYVEIPACGAVICGDLPDEDKDNFNEFMITVSVKDSDETIIQKIEYILQNQIEWNKLSEKGNIWSLNYTQEKYASRLYIILSQILEST